MMFPQAATEDLFQHHRYERAKYFSDAAAAYDLCLALANDEIMFPLWDELLAIEPRPLVVAPSKPIGETSNALGRGYASWFAKEMSCEWERGIVQINRVSRDRERSRYVRLVHEPLYEGPVEEGRSYIIADDVCTMGGTMAALRGFIESRGGMVILTTALAAGDGAPIKISLDGATELGLINAHDGGLSALVNAELGYDVSCLTEAEGRFLLERASLDAVRAGIRQARH